MSNLAQTSFLLSICALREQCYQAWFYIYSIALAAANSNIYFSLQMFFIESKLKVCCEQYFEVRTTLSLEKKF